MLTLTVVRQQAPARNTGTMEACLAGMCLCCCAEGASFCQLLREPCSPVIDRALLSIRIELLSLLDDISTDSGYFYYYAFGRIRIMMILPSSRSANPVRSRSGFLTATFYHFLICSHQCWLTKGWALPWPDDHTWVLVPDLQVAVKLQPQKFGHTWSRS